MSGPQLLGGGLLPAGRAAFVVIGGVEYVGVLPGPFPLVSSVLDP